LRTKTGDPRIGRVARNSLKIWCPLVDSNY
jgi:hypothetical protein